MAVFHAYLDESYTDVWPQLLCIGGYLIEKEAADIMARDWSSVLEKASIPFYHARDFGPGKIAIYKHLNDGERVSIQTELIELIKKHVRWGIAFMVNPARVDPTVGAEGYAFCALSCLGAMSSKMRADKIQGTISYFFEQGHRDEGRALQYMEKMLRQRPDPHVKSIDFIGKNENPLLQAADMLVYHSSKFVKDRVRLGKYPRKDFSSLVEKKHSIVYAIVENMNINLWIDENKIDITAPRHDENLRKMFGDDPQYKS